MAVAAALVAIGLVPVLSWGGNLDAAWYLYVAQRVLAGAHLYRDIIEINPPLIVALSIPPAWLAHALGVLDLTVYNLATAALALAVVAFAARLLTRLGEDGPGRAGPRRILILLCLAALFPMAAADFGQREHLLLALVLPYLCLSAVRAEGRSASRAQAVSAGVMAAVGLALKPFYLPLWAVVEAYLILGRRAGPPWRRAETVTIAATLLAYGLAVVLCAPGYVTLAERLGPVYTALLRESPLRILATPDGVLPLLAALAMVATPTAAGWRGLRDVMVVAVLTSLAAVLLQQKGWSYHYYPARAESLVALGVALLSAAHAPIPRVRAAAARLPALVLAAGLAVVLVQRGREAWAEGEYERVVIRGELAPLVRRYAPGQAILGLTVSPTPAFPLVNFTGARWALRFPSLWMIPALHARGQWIAPTPGGPARLGPEQRYLVTAVTDDFLAWRPALLFQYAPPWGAPDLVGYFAAADPRFAAALAAYHAIGVVGDYRFYARDSEVSR